MQELYVEGREEGEEMLRQGDGEGEEREIGKQTRMEQKLFWFFFAVVLK